MKQALMFLILTLGWSSGEVNKRAPQKKRALPSDVSEQIETTHTFDTECQDNKNWGHKQFTEVTITKNVPVPYPVKVERHVPIPVRVPFPVAIRHHVPILVQRNIPIYVEKPIPVQVDRPVPYPLPIEVPVFHKMAVEVPKPYPIHIPKPYPVYIQRHVPQTEMSPTKRVKKNTVKVLRYRH
ncbi:MAGE-like protein 2 [Topomyia yanbarensis]|uniref:MAGE-like protein 2 n=1 Tax=Topomyia yanbarensis TaxID=2498891 RepID=UPI00273A7A5F|nr:MAGE-like protein 2 [Topomyia yanbarensis]